jgi:hypothetical protein
VADAYRNGEFFDVWTVAGLGRDELRNSAVLAWLLNCRGTHGQDHRFLKSLLSQVVPSIPEQTIAGISKGTYQTRVESYPLGNRRDRIDIEIESSECLLFIEVKIDAIVDIDQLYRYARRGVLKASDRQLHIILIRPSTGLEIDLVSGKIASATWNDVARSLRATLRQRK